MMQHHQSKFEIRLVGLLQDVGDIADELQAEINDGAIPITHDNQSEFDAAGLALELLFDQLKSLRLHKSTTPLEIDPAAFRARAT